MTKIRNSKQKYDLEERTLRFAKRVRRYVRNLPKTSNNIEDGKQLIRSSGSIGANYIEANEAISKKDFRLRIKIARKEAKESRFWLKLTEPTQAWNREKEDLIKESTELMKIFGSILEKLK